MPGRDSDDGRASRVPPLLPLNDPGPREALHDLAEIVTRQDEFIRQLLYETHFRAGAGCEKAAIFAERLLVSEKTNEIQRRILVAAARRPRICDELVDRLRDGGFLGGDESWCKVFPPLVQLTAEQKTSLRQELEVLSEEYGIFRMLEPA